MVTDVKLKGPKQEVNFGGKTGQENKRIVILP